MHLLLPLPKGHVPNMATISWHTGWPYWRRIPNMEKQEYNKWSKLEVEILKDSLSAEVRLNIVNHYFLELVSEWVSELVYLMSLLNSQGLMSDRPGAGQWDEGWKGPRHEWIHQVSIPGPRDLKSSVLPLNQAHRAFLELHHLHMLHVKWYLRYILWTSNKKEHLTYKLLFLTDFCQC